jgi:hypothetical protein
METCKSLGTISSQPHVGIDGIYDNKPIVTCINCGLFLKSDNNEWLTFHKTIRQIPPFAEVDSCVGTGLEVLLCPICGGYGELARHHHFAGRNSTWLEESDPSFCEACGSAGVIIHKALNKILKMDRELCQK